MPPEKNRSTATGNMDKKFGGIRSHGVWVMQEPYKQTDILLLIIKLHTPTMDKVIMAVVYSHWPMGTYLAAIHQLMIIVEWWYTCRNVTWLFFLRRMKNTLISTHQPTAIVNHSNYMLHTCRNNQFTLPKQTQQNCRLSSGWRRWCELDKKGPV